MSANFRFIIYLFILIGGMCYERKVLCCLQLTIKNYTTHISKLFNYLDKDIRTIDTDDLRKAAPKRILSDIDSELLNINFIETPGAFKE